MPSPDQDRIDIEPDPEVAGRDPIQVTPGAMEEVEDANALASRTEPQRTLRRSPTAGDAGGGGEGQDPLPQADDAPAGDDRGGPDWGTAADPMR